MRSTELVEGAAFGGALALLMAVVEAHVVTRPKMIMDTLTDNIIENLSDELGKLNEVIMFKTIVVEVLLMTVTTLEAVTGRTLNRRSLQRIIDVMFKARGQMRLIDTEDHIRTIIC